MGSVTEKETSEGGVSEIEDRWIELWNLKSRWKKIEKVDRA